MNAAKSPPVWSLGARPTAVALIAGVLVLLGFGAPRSAPDASAPACSVQRFEDEWFTVCRFDPARNEVRLFDKTADGAALRSFEALSAQLGERAPRLRFAMNAGMYDEQGAPIGLYVEDGAELHAVNSADGHGNFHLKPNGVFWVGQDGRAHVSETSAFMARKPAPVWATQSGPMLVIDGRLHPGILNDGPSRLVRNAVGVTRDGRALFVISSDAVSFGKLARFGRDTLKCPNMLFLDGAVSSLWAPNLHRQDRRNDLGPMVAVFENSD